MTRPHDSINIKAQAEGPLRPPKAAIVIIGFLVIAAVIFVASSLRQSAPLTFYPVSVVDPQEVGE